MKLPTLHIIRKLKYPLHGISINLLLMYIDTKFIQNILKRLFVKNITNSWHNIHIRCMYWKFKQNRTFLSMFNKMVNNAPIKVQPYSWCLRLVFQYVTYCCCFFFHCIHIHKASKTLQINLIIWLKWYAIHVSLSMKNNHVQTHDRK